MKYSLYLLILLVSILSCCSTKEEPKLAWSDEFNYTGAPDSNSWNYDLGDVCPNVCGWGNNELEYYTKDSKNVRVENEML